MFGCFSRTVRLNDTVIRAWSRILGQVPGSKLLLNYKTFVDAGARTFFASRFAAFGTDPSRVHMVFTTPQPATWSAYNEVDIALDPFPHNAGTTTLEALWMGVPVVTLASCPPVGTLGAGILKPIGLTDWVAANEDDYVRIAVERSRDLPGLSKLRGMLRAQVANSPLCDSRRFADDLGAGYRQMWRRWCESLT